jgi:hypothetical protein
MDGPAGAATATIRTYAQLRHIIEAKGRNMVRNHAFLSRLRQFAGRGEDDDAATDLADPELTAGLLESFRGERGFHNRTSALAQLREYVAAPPAELHSLQALLAHALAAAGSTLAAAATAARPDKPPRVASHWLRNFLNSERLPSERSRAGIARLECHLGLVESTLLQFVNGSTGGGWKLRRLFDLRNPLYSFDPERTPRAALPDRMLRELELYFEFKTRPSPVVELPGGGVKRLKRSTKYTETKIPVNHIGERRQLGKKWWNYASCAMVQDTVRSIYTHVAVKRGTRDLDSIAFLANPALIEDFISSEVEKRGEYNGQHEYVVTFCSSMLDQTVGFFTQLPEIFLEPYQRYVDPEVTPGTWQASIRRRQEEIRDIPRRLKPNTPANRRIQMTRQKKRKLQKILEMERFYERVVFPTVRYLEENRPPPDVQEARRLSYELDLLILVCFAACPLRLLNWANAEWGKHLVREDAGWRLIIPRQEIKNRRWLGEDFDVDLPAWCTPRLDRYYDKVRPLVRLRRPGTPDLVMLSPTTNGQGGSRTYVSRVYAQINDRMGDFTKALWNVRVSPHDWRDIYATDYLHEHPEGALVVAMMLNDKVETILARYAKPNYRRMSRVAARYFDEAYTAARRSGLGPAGPGVWPGAASGGTARPVR